MRSNRTRRRRIPRSNPLLVGSEMRFCRIGRHPSGDAALVALIEAERSRQRLIARFGARRCGYTCAARATMLPGAPRAALS